MGLTAPQMVDAIKQLTSKTQALQAPAQAINIINGPLIVIGQGPIPQVIAGLGDIIMTATTSLAQAQGSSKYTSGFDSDAVFDAYREHVRVAQVLLNILIEKAGLFNQIPLIGQPMAAVLRQYENVMDTLGFSLIDACESRATDLTSQANSLGGTVTTAINSYDSLGLASKL